MVVPRSSISKTPLELANSIGIIDRGYTGTLKVAVRNHSAWVVHLEAGTSLFQLVRPDLEPAIVKVVGEEHEAFRAGASLRGEGGFGSTGASGDGAGGANASANASADASKGVSIGSFGSYESSDVGCGYGSIRGGYESLGIGGARD
jgi:hypothetical protein